MRRNARHPWDFNIGLENFIYPISWSFKHSHSKQNVIIEEINFIATDHGVMII